MYIIVTIKDNAKVGEEKRIQDARAFAETYRVKHGKATGVKLAADWKGPRK